MTPAPKSRWFRFLLRTFLIMAVLASLALAIPAKALDSARERRRIENAFHPVTPILRVPTFPASAPATH